MNPEIRVVRPKSPDDLLGLSTLLGAAFGTNTDWQAQIKWQYLKNPLGPTWVANAYLPNGTVIAHVAFQPLPHLSTPALGKGHPVFFSFNTAVHPNAPVPGLFPALTRHLFQAMLKELGEFSILGVANENSGDGFVRFLGFKDLGPMQLKVFPPWELPASNQPRTLLASSEYIRWRLARPDSQIRLHPRSGQPLRRIYHLGIPIDVVLTADSIEATCFPLKDKPIRLPGLRLYATSESDLEIGTTVPGRLRPSPLRRIAKTFPSSNMDSLLSHLQITRFEFLDFDVV